MTLFMRDVERMISSNTGTLPPAHKASSMKQDLTAFGQGVHIGKVRLPHKTMSIHDCIGMTLTN